MSNHTRTPPIPASGRVERLRWWIPARTSLFWMVMLALVLRLGWIFIAHTYKFRTSNNDFSFGWEMGRIGRSLASGQGFSSPFDESTGPTAWEPPIYPLLIAGIFKVFGIYSQTSAIVLLVINSLFSALNCIPIFLIAKRCFSEKVAVWSAWTWALLPSVMYWSTRWVWETSLATFLLTMIFWLTLTLPHKDGVRPWCELGTLWGAAALTNTTLLSFLPASGLWLWHQRSKGNKKSAAGLLAAAVVFAACVAPWLIRNEQTFGQFVFIRSNFGAELRLGNGPGAAGVWMEYLHPTQNVFQMRRYRQLGEIKYVAERKREAVAFIREDYDRFVRLSAKRFIYYWGGIPQSSERPVFGAVKNSLFLASSVLAIWGLGRALRKHRPGAWLFLWLMLSYPMVYYFVFPHPRYRHPIEPELGILILYLISEASWRRAKLQAQYSPGLDSLPGPVVPT